METFIKVLCTLASVMICLLIIHFCRLGVGASFALGLAIGVLNIIAAEYLVEFYERYF